MTSLVHPATGEVVDVHPAADLLPAPTTDEQAVIEGRSTSNALRLQVVEWLENDDTLRELPTVGDVCRAVGVDPAALDLDELAVDEASA